MAAPVAIPVSVMLYRSSARKNLEKCILDFSDEIKTRIRNLESELQEKLKEVKFTVTTSEEERIESESSV